MNIADYGPIDCDIHPAVAMPALLPYLDEYWRDAIVARGIARANHDVSSYPPNAPLSVRPDWKPETGNPGSDLALIRSQLLDPFGTRFAIANCVHGAMMYANEYMAAALCRAVNDWLAAEWLTQEPRLRASILIPPESPELAVEEIERRAGDKRFVQILMLVMGSIPLGKRYHWPIFEAAERHGLAIGIHAGSLYRNAPTSVGWPSYVLEDYVAQSQAFEGQLLSLVAEGVFVKFPKLKIVMLESGFTWLPAYFWRADKTWRGVRSEVPWVDRLPSDYVREHVRFTIQPTDAPPEPQQLARIIEQIGSDDVLLFSSDYPHWHYEGTEVIPAGLPERLLQKVLVDNPLATYPRLGTPARL